MTKDKNTHGWCSLLRLIIAEQGGTVTAKDNISLLLDDWLTTIKQH